MSPWNGFRVVIQTHDTKFESKYLRFQSKIDLNNQKNGHALLFLVLLYYFDDDETYQTLA